MDKIASSKKVKEIIANHSFYFKKNYGQNFLIDSGIINKIISSSEITKDDLVIEIGPGIGGLTEELSLHAKKVIAIEIDNHLIPILGETLKDYNNIEIINKDVLKVDLNALIKENGFESAKIVANLPYYITTPIIMNVLESTPLISQVTVMIQKEVAERMCASPSTKDYGSLTLAVGYYCNSELVTKVPEHCFIPMPKVTSAVVKLTRKPKPFDIKDEKLFFSIIKSAFSMRRKTLLNCLFKDFSLNKQELEQLLIKCDLNPKVRGETLVLEDFYKLYLNLKETI